MRGQSCSGSMGTTTWRPLPPVVLRKLSRPSALEALADVGGGWRRASRQAMAGVGIEVDDDAVGVLEVVVAGAPGMDFEDSDLGEAGEGFGSGEGDVGLDFAGLLVADGNGLDAGRQGVVDVLLEEAGLAGAVGAADERERAVGDVRQHVRGDGPVVVGELLLGEAGFGVEDFVGVGEADGGVLGAGRFVMDLRILFAGEVLGAAGRGCGVRSVAWRACFVFRADGWRGVALRG